MACQIKKQSELREENETLAWTHLPENDFSESSSLDVLIGEARGGEEDEGEVLKVRDASTVDMAAIRAIHAIAFMYCI